MQISFGDKKCRLALANQPPQKNAPGKPWHSLCPKTGSLADSIIPSSRADITRNEDFLFEDNVWCEVVHLFNFRWQSVLDGSGQSTIFAKTKSQVVCVQLPPPTN